MPVCTMFPSDLDLAAHNEIASSVIEEKEWVFRDPVTKNDKIFGNNGTIYRMAPFS
jgi:hypothetical protein